MNTISKREKLQIVKEWLLLQRLGCSHKETIGLLIELVDREITQQLEATKNVDKGDFVGRKAKIIHCGACHHISGNRTCICHLMGQTVTISTLIGRDFYRIKEESRAVTLDEFELLPEQPVQAPAHSP
ncbi:MAG: hypothetical protein WC711_02715 [Candidatus Staskawiczbacteria bacterium]|jgi:hypothetical protein